MSLVLSKSAELSKDDMQLVARSSHHCIELDGKEEEEQLIHCSECKSFENIRSGFVLLITWDGVLVFVTSRVDLINFPSSCRFSVSWIMLFFPLHPQDTI